MVDPAPIDVSVVVPVRDGERYLAAALESILNQTLPPREVVVVDDGSRDGSHEVAEKYAPLVRCIRQPPLGLSNAVNYGVLLAEFDFIASLDSDDLWTDDKLERQVAAFRSDPSLDVVLGLVENFHSPDLSERERASVTGAAGQRVAPLRGAMLARRATFDRVGPSDPRFRVGEFIDWWARAEHAGLRTMVIPRLVLRRRIHRDNMSRLAGEERVDYVRIARAALQRRRGSQTRGMPT